MDAREIVRISRNAAIATDADDRVLACNEPVDKLLGYDRQQVIGRRFRNVFAPKDIFNNPLTYDGSLFFGLLEQGSPIRNFQCNLRTACGDYQRTALSVVVVTNRVPSSHQLVYMLWPVMRRRKADEVIARLLNGAGYGAFSGLGEDLRAVGKHQSVLTDRQVEILRLVAAGESTAEVANKLCISPDTVRNHIRNILSRLGAHSRAEAVSVAHKRHLI